MAEAHLTCCKYADVKDELERSEAVLREMKHKQAMLRVQTQSRLLIEAQRSRLAQERALEQRSREEEEQSKVSLMRAQKAMQDGREFLKSSLARYSYNAVCIHTHHSSFPVYVIVQCHVQIAT